METVELDNPTGSRRFLLTGLMLLWFLIVGAFDFAAIFNLCQQAQTIGFAPARGKVIFSWVEVTPKVTKAHILYRYSIDGGTFKSSRKSGPTQTLGDLGCC